MGWGLSPAARTVLFNWKVLKLLQLRGSHAAADQITPKTGKRDAQNRNVATKIDRGLGHPAS